MKTHVTIKDKVEEGQTATKIFFESTAEDGVITLQVQGGPVHAVYKAELLQAIQAAATGNE